MLQTLKVNCSLTFNSGAEALKPQEATSIPSSELNSYSICLSSGAALTRSGGSS